MQESILDTSQVVGIQKMFPYIYAEQNGIHVIDLYKHHVC